MADEELEQTNEELEPTPGVADEAQQGDQPGEGEEQQSSGGGGDDGPPPEECPPCKGGAPAWMATFADMATLLMAFFVLLLSFSDVELPKFEQINGAIKNAFGVKRIIPEISLPMARSLIVENFSPALAERTLIDNVQQMPIDPNKENLIRRTKDKLEKYPIQEELKTVQAALAEEIERGDVTVKIRDERIVVEMAADKSAAGPGSNGQSQSSAGNIEQRMVDIASRVAQVQGQVSREVNLFLNSGDQPQGGEVEGAKTQGQMAQGRAADNDLFNEIRSNLQGEIQQGLVEVERDGDDVIIRLASQGSFVSGSADLSDTFGPLLRQVGEPLASEGRSLRIEGHTDNIPIAFSQRFNSNWDLSAARSASVADFFSSELGIGSQRMKVSGFADTRPLEGNDTAEGRARNRRIEIIVEGN
jgi:chemotaxis protein MotB